MHTWWQKKMRHDTMMISEPLFYLISMIMNKNTHVQKKVGRFAKDRFGDIIDESYSAKDKTHKLADGKKLQSVIKKITRTS